MKNKIFIFTLFTAFMFGLIFVSPANSSVKKQVTVQSVESTVVLNKNLTAKTQAEKSIVAEVDPLALIENPSKYLNKKVKIKGLFSKFSVLGLDYKPAMKSSEEYITFLIRRPNVTNEIPLSELKNFIKRTTAEKFIDLNSGDEVEYTGTVFSTALGDAWVDVESFSVIKKKESEKK